MDTGKMLSQMHPELMLIKRLDAKIARMEYGMRRDG